MTSKLTAGGFAPFEMSGNDVGPSWPGRIVSTPEW